MRCLFVPGATIHIPPRAAHTRAAALLSFEHITDGIRPRHAHSSDEIPRFEAEFPCELARKLI